jgi:hypothetical protein
MGGSERRGNLLRCEGLIWFVSKITHPKDAIGDEDLDVHHSVDHSTKVSPMVNKRIGNAASKQYTCFRNYIGR